MKNKFRIAFFLSLCVFAITANLVAQVVYEPLYKDVYDFLRRLSTKGVIEYNDEFRPLSRKYLAEKLLEAEKYPELLTELQMADLKFYKQDYYHEIWFIENEKNEKHLNFFSNDPADRWRVFSYGDENFKMNLSPILGYEIGPIENEKATHLWNGIYTYGYITDALGVSFDFRDNTEEGTTIDKTKRFTPVTGVNARSSSNIVDYSENKIEYSEAKGIIATDWSWGSFAIGKEFMEWGYAENGLIVLSQKAPSFPFIRLDINPVEWLGFNYFHAWLSSDVVDSTDIYYTETGTERISFRKKFIASHTLFIRPLEGLKLSLGESIVYSDQLEIAYLIPVMFFRLADHYLSRQNNSAGNNAQFFAAISSRNHIKNTHLYGSLFIDEVTLSGLFDSYKQRNQFGFTLGASVVDLPLDNLTLTAEYSKIYPFVYNNFIQTITYENASYIMGHWMGNNDDQIYGSIKYRFLRGLEASMWARYIRKGEAGKVSDQYEQPQPPFLFGLRTNYTYLGAMVKYEFIHELFVRVKYQYMKTSQQQENLSFIDKTVNEFHFAIYYGM
ncbi:capsule assembly Wzi family protein [Bacteroidota bacterium]